MLVAKKVGFWKNTYEISVAGQLVTTWEKSSWTRGGAVELDGRRLEIRGNLWGTRYTMTDEEGAELAAADRVGRKRWTVEADGRIHELRRASMWRQEELLLADGREVGSIRRSGPWRRDATAELPGLPLPLQVFVFVVTLTKWDAARAAAAAGGSGAG